MATAAVNNEVEFKMHGLTPSIMMGVMWGGIGLATTFTVLRTAVRLHVSHRLFLDDLWVYVALALLLVMGIVYSFIMNFIFELELVAEGLYKPLETFQEQASFFLKCQFAIIVLFWSTLWAVKFSFLFHYKRLFNGLPTLTRAWYGVSIFSLLAYIGCWATQLSSCAPLSHYFVIGACETQRDIFVSNLSLYYATIVDIICDIMIMALPLRLIWNLQVNSRQKVALFSIFSLGVIIIIFALVRVIETRATTKHVDPIWLALWSMLEASIAVTVSCLPSFKVLFTHHSPSAYNANQSPSGSSRFSRAKRTPRASTAASCFSSRLSRTPRGAIRLEPLDHKGLEAGEDLTNAKGGVEVHIRQMGHTAGAEGLNARERSGAESQEDILPKVPENGVHVRNDFYMTSEPV